MLYANVNGTRTLASKGLLGSCPACCVAVRPKCGKIISHHWAHEAADCDPWYEPMTAWHLGWQERFPEHMREVTIGPHRADVKTSKCVIEFQHSPISVEDIQAREAFYGNMVWVFSWPKGAQLFGLGEYNGGERMIRLLKCKPSLAKITKPLFFDLGRITLLTPLVAKQKADPYGCKLESERMLGRTLLYVNHARTDWQFRPGRTFRGHLVSRDQFIRELV